MNFGELHDALVAQGYADEAAYAKIAHDIVLKAVRDSGFHDSLTVKGGVVMSGITNLARRATMDMDIDFLHYSLANVSIRKFISELNRVAPCRIRLRGPIQALRQQEYEGKRVYLEMIDDVGFRIDTKVDIGVHARMEVKQTKFAFRVVTGAGPVALLVNPMEQMFVEKLKSLLRLGAASTRFKDVFDLYYLSSRVSRSDVRALLKIYVFDDEQMRENDVADIEKRLRRIFASERYMRSLSRPTCAWLDVSPEEVTAKILSCVAELANATEKMR